MTDLSHKTALVVDSNNGLFLPVALRLAKDGFGRVLYHTFCEDGFPRIGRCVLGDGFDTIERCDDPWKVKNEVDCFVFPDIHNSGLQLELESQGKAVWGSRGGDCLEINRQKFHRVLGDLKLEVPPHENITGVTNLSEYLRDKKDKYIKVSRFRGSFETAHWRSWDEDESNLDYWAVEFGSIKEMVRFMVFDKIGDDLEIGGDPFNIDGQWPKLMLRGDELKDKVYIGAVTPMEKMPEPIQEVMEAFGPLLKEQRYRNFLSIEMRGEGDKWFFIDAACRFGLPSSASQLALWSNFPEIIWAGAHGELVEPEPSAMFSVEAVLTLKGEKGAWRKTRFPDSLKDNAMLNHCCLIDGAHCFPPDECHEIEIGWLQASGDSIENAIVTLKGYEEDLPEGVAANSENLVGLLKEIHAAKEEGIPFAKDVPEPEMVIQD